MRVNLIIIITTVVTLCGAVSLHAQGYTPAPVKVSSEILALNGNLYYAHRVLEKQTLFSISKTYGVSIEEINNCNPKLIDGLKKDSIILIPVVSGKGETEKSDTTEGKTPAKEETPVQAETQAETQVEAEVKAEVPAATAAAEQVKVDNNPQTTIHVVKWYEDLESIAKKYGVTAQAIINTNNLTGNKLKNRQKLVIPEKAEEVQPAEVPAPDPVSAAAAIPAVAAAANGEQAVTKGISTSTQDEHTDTKVPAVPADTVQLIDKPVETIRNLLNIKRKVNLMVMLPLNAVSGSSGNANYMDFYSGVLLAARDKGVNGIEVNLDVKDVASGLPSSIKNDAEEADVILGPVSPEDMGKVLALGGFDKPVFSPMNPKCEYLAKGHANFVQAPPDSYAQYADMLEWIKSDMKSGDRVIVIYEKGSKECAESSTVNTLLKSSGLEYATVSYKVIDGSHIMGTIQKQMTPSESSVNRVVIASEQEAFVNDVCRNLSLLLHESYNVVLYGTSKFKNYDTIEIDSFHALNLHQSSSYNVDYESAKVKDFVMKYRALFKTEPTAFAYQGYDLSFYLIDTFSKHQYDWQEYICSERVRMLQADFLFERAEEGENGFINKAVKRCIYGPEYSIRAVRQ